MIKTCQYCGSKIMFVGVLWLRADVADVNGFCPKSPDDDQHHPESAGERLDRSSPLPGALPTAISSG